MKYSFKIQIVSDLVFYTVKVENSELYCLTRLTDAFWTKQKIQEIIDGVATTKNTAKDYKFQTEGDDLYIYSNSFGVQFFNLESKNKEADLVLEHDIFISFLKDFKKFVEENS